MEFYLNIASIGSIFEAEITLLFREEYDEQLKKVMAGCRSSCADYVYDPEGDNLEGHKEKMCFDGTCRY